MCIAIPGKVVSIEGSLAKVNYSGNMVDADIRLVDVKVGDYVLVHAGCAIEVLKPSQADELLELLGEIEALSDEQPS